ncbi:phage tail tape measure protein [Escherichia coli]|uniref:phage tail tape measure protein n=1 Tax=Escherichia coli TaxID=562 RepID=UPI001CECFE9C|nr:phage tail tape measure protein [Escherichia coli]MCA6194466.1 phage tail tape measure protein [Escherichia coli]
MAEPVGDLVVDLSLDAARFDEQMARVRRHFSGTESDAKKTAAVVEQSLSRQALAAQKAGISVGQYKAAMRMLPAQFTDVATQLAGGQSPWLILLQQGGQVKDSFGGMIPMFRGLAGAITLPMVGATSLAVATGALAYAWYQGDSTLSDFNKTLVLSGNQAGLTADRMLVLSRAGQAAGLTFNQTSESLTALVNAGVRGGEQFEAISQSVARFSSASGVEVDKVAEAFGKLTTDGIAQNMAAMLTGSEQNWRSFTRSVLSMMTEILLKQAMVGIVGSIGSAIGGAVGGDASASGGTAIQAAAAKFHFATGGFTGTGGKYEPAGIVHRGEFVFTKEATSRIGVGNLYRLMRGYAEGGYVGGAGSPAQMRRAEGINFNQNNHVVIQNDGTNGLPGPQMMKAVYDMARKGARDEIQAQMRDGGLFSGGGR